MKSLVFRRTVKSDRPNRSLHWQKRSNQRTPSQISTGFPSIRYAKSGGPVSTEIEIQHVLFRISPRRLKVQKTFLHAAPGNNVQCTRNLSTARARFVYYYVLSLYSGVKTNFINHTNAKQLKDKVALNEKKKTKRNENDFKTVKTTDPPG